MNELLLSVGPILQIVLINIVLSGDNAVVIAMAARHLPGNQRRRAMLWGCLFAVALRIVLTLVVASVLLIPGVRLAGALLLAWIACRLLQDETTTEPQPGAARTSLRTAICRIALADLVMSFDNVVAIAGVSRSNPAHLALGLALSIATILAFSTTIIAILDRFRWLVYAGTAVLAATAAQMLWHDVELLPAMLSTTTTPTPLPAWAGWGLQVGIVALCLTSNRWWPRRTSEVLAPELDPVLAAANERMPVTAAGTVLLNDQPA